MSKFTKRTVNIGGRKVPGIQMSDTEHGTVTLPPTDFRPTPKVIPASFADILTLRETNPIGPDGQPQPVTQYLRMTRENLGFTTLRFDTVVGLDVAEDGITPLSVEVLENRRNDDILARQLARAAAQTSRVVSLDDDEDENAPEGELAPSPA